MYLLDVNEYMEKRSILVFVLFDTGIIQGILPLFDFHTDANSSSYMVFA